MTALSPSDARLVEMAAACANRRFNHKGGIMPLEDGMQEARLGAIRGLDKWERSTKTVARERYAYLTARTALIDALRDWTGFRRKGWMPTVHTEDIEGFDAAAPDLDPAEIVAAEILDRDWSTEQIRTVAIGLSRDMAKIDIAEYLGVSGGRVSQIVRDVRRDYLRGEDA